MADIFGSPARGVQAWKMGRAMLTIPGLDRVAVKAATVSFVRPSMTFSPINMTDNFVVAGEGSGGIELTTLIGPSASIRAFLERFGDVCRIDSNTLTLTPAGDITPCVGSSKPDGFVLSGVLFNSIQISAQSPQEAGGLSMTQGTITGTILSLRFS